MWILDIMFRIAWEETLIISFQQINILGEKDDTPVHFCDKCGLPIKIYGRMVSINELNPGFVNVNICVEVRFWNLSRGLSFNK